MTAEVEDRLRDLFEADARGAPAPDTLATGAVRRVRRRRRTLAGAGAAVAVTVAVAGGLAGARPDGNGAPVAAPTAAAPTGATQRGETASCLYPDDRTLPQQAIVFDGTIVAIAPVGPDRVSSVTFRVNQWLKGGRGPTVTINMSRSPSTDILSEYGPPAFDLGTRLLVSGGHRRGGRTLDDVYAGGCGFTQYYDAAEAARWQHAFN
jgi:hypothetical protein